MINPIEHVRAIYRSKQPARQVRMLRLTNFDFMKESPFAKSEKPKLSFLQRAKQYIENKRLEVKQYIADKKADVEFRKRLAKNRTSNTSDLHSMLYD